jgi:hypothetical protein
MDPRVIPAQLAVIGLLGLTALGLVTGVDVSLVDRPGVHMAMPDTLDGWTGCQVLYCHARTCDWSGDASDEITACPDCESELFPMSWVEKTQLPPDTEFLKYHYRSTGGRTLAVSIVLSGNERNSIHRPQRCLVAQGLEIVETAYPAVDLPGREPLTVAMLDTMMRRRRGTRGVPLAFAYWFVGQERETPSHTTRMAWLAWDRVVHGKAHRWAYILVQGEYGTDAAGLYDQLESFLPLWYPAVLRND